MTALPYPEGSQELANGVSWANIFFISPLSKGGHLPYPEGSQEPAKGDERDQKNLNDQKWKGPESASQRQSN